mgnify:CR=1 FL=1
MTDAEPAVVECQNCHKRLAHNKRYCPLFPETDPPPIRHYLPNSAAFTEEPGRKWGSCPCTIHTCSIGAQSR